uniref:Transposase n=2 Tax=Acidithiobacillus sulfuriphilus TaxID=1867749 RepID=A0A3M8QR85_9PROT|nr:transposase [Acidithiobacillus sulfuriphilus]
MPIKLDAATTTMVDIFITEQGNVLLRWSILRQLASPRYSVPYASGRQRVMHLRIVIAPVSEDHRLLSSKEPIQHLMIRYLGRREVHRLDDALEIRCHLSLHPEIPLIPFLRGAHLRIPLAVSVLGTLQAMRIRAVSAVRKGQPVEQVAEVFGLNKRTVFRWVALFLTGGQKALQAKPIPGRPPKLNAQQLAWLAQALRKHPEQYEFPFALWTLAMVRDLIARRFAQEVSLCLGTSPCGLVPFG